MHFIAPTFAYQQTAEMDTKANLNATVRNEKSVSSVHRDDEKINKYQKQILALLMNIFICRNQTYSTQSTHLPNDIKML